MKALYTSMDFTWILLRKGVRPRSGFRSGSVWFDLVSTLRVGTPVFDAPRHRGRPGRPGAEPKAHPANAERRHKR
jgi:hypothetical protein